MRLEEFLKSEEPKKLNKKFIIFSNYIINTHQILSIEKEIFLENEKDNSNITFYLPSICRAYYCSNEVISKIFDKILEFLLNDDILLNLDTIERE